MQMCLGETTNDRSDLKMKQKESYPSSDNIFHSGDINNWNAYLFKSFSPKQ